MAKKNKNKSGDISAVELLAFLSALFYMQSVLTVAHHTSMWIHDGSVYTVGPPAIPALVIGLSSVAYSVFKDKFKVSTLNVITLTIFATASLFWLSGLRTNFHF